MTPNKVKWSLKNTDFSPSQGRTSWCFSSFSLLKLTSVSGPPPPSHTPALLNLFHFGSRYNGWGGKKIEPSLPPALLWRFSDPPPQPVNTYEYRATTSDLLPAEAWKIGPKCFPGHPSDHIVTSPTPPPCSFLSITNWLLIWWASVAGVEWRHSFEIYGEK